MIGSGYITRLSNANVETIVVLGIAIVVFFIIYQLVK